MVCVVYCCRRLQPIGSFAIVFRITIPCTQSLCSSRLLRLLATTTTFFFSFHSSVVGFVLFNGTSFWFICDVNNVSDKHIQILWRFSAGEFHANICICIVVRHACSVPRSSTWRPGEFKCMGCAQANKNELKDGRAGFAFDSNPSYTRSKGGRKE